MGLLLILLVTLIRLRCYLTVLVLLADLVLTVEPLLDRGLVSGVRLILRLAFLVQAVLPIHGVEDEVLCIDVLRLLLVHDVEDALRVVVELGDDALGHGVHLVFALLHLAHVFLSLLDARGGIDGRDGLNAVDLDGALEGAEALWLLVECQVFNEVDIVLDFFELA